MLGLLELGLQLGLQLPAALLELQQLLLGLLEAVGQQGSVLSPERNRRGPLGPQREPQILNYIGLALNHRYSLKGLYRPYIYILLLFYEFIILQ